MASTFVPPFPRRFQPRSYTKDCESDDYLNRNRPPCGDYCRPGEQPDEMLTCRCEGRQVGIAGIAVLPAVCLEKCPCVCAGSDVSRASHSINRDTTKRPLKRLRGFFSYSKANSTTGQRASFSTASLPEPVGYTAVVDTAVDTKLAICSTSACVRCGCIGSDSWRRARRSAAGQSSSELENAGVRGSGSL